MLKNIHFLKQGFKGCILKKLGYIFCLGLFLPHGFPAAFASPPPNTISKPKHTGHIKTIQKHKPHHPIITKSKQTRLKQRAPKTILKETSIQKQKQSHHAVKKHPVTKPTRSIHRPTKTSHSSKNAMPKQKPIHHVVSKKPMSKPIKSIHHSTKVLPPSKIAMRRQKQIHHVVSKKPMTKPIKSIHRSTKVLLTSKSAMPRQKPIHQVFTTVPTKSIVAAKHHVPSPKSSQLFHLDTLSFALQAPLRYFKAEKHQMKKSHPNKKHPPNKWFTYEENVINLSLGSAWSMTPPTQTFYLQPDIQKTYQSSASPSAFFDVELFLGYQKRIAPLFVGQFGLEIAGTTKTTLPGDIWEDADPTFNNYNYSYTVNHARLALKGRLLADKVKWVSPYASASAGLGFNQASGFTIMPKIYQEVAAPAFNDQWSTTFSYTLGIGLEKRFNKQWQVGLGYEFADFGKSQLARAPGQTLNEGLTAEHLYVNALLLSASYVY